MLPFCFSTCNFAICFGRRLPVDYDGAWTTLLTDHSHVFRGWTGRWGKRFITINNSEWKTEGFKQRSITSRDPVLMESFTKITRVVNRWNVHMRLNDLLASNVVPWAVILHVLVFLPLVTMTENSYRVLGFRPVTMWFRFVVLAVWKMAASHELKCESRRKI